MTNAQYAAFDPAHRWEEMSDVSRDELAHHPVVRVTWYAAMSFCRWLSTIFPGARLPLEEEWEVACRAGTATVCWSGDGEEDLGRVGWNDQNSDDRTHRVGEKPANPWGLYDMHGNVFEWMLTPWSGEPYEGREGGFRLDPAAPPADPAAAASATRVVRGGGHWLVAVDTRAAFRGNADPAVLDGGQGFRAMLPPGAASSERP